MNSKTIFIILIILSTSIFSSDKTEKNCKSAADNILITNPEGDKAPDFSLKSVDGKTIKLSDYEGKIVIIDFWATWCPPCRKGIPDLILIQKKYKDDVVIIGISLDGDKTKKDVPGFVKDQGINYPIVYGDNNVVTAYGGIESIPTAFVIDKKGNVVDKHVGLVDKQVYADKIKELMK
jgi:cytochrome c biogenesis protein CcmG/thiol:disulfide interchange protein DsbE